MMMMTQFANQKRKSYEEFLISNADNPMRNHKQSSSDNAQPVYFTSNDKRARFGIEGANISTKEKKDKVGERVSRLQQLVSPFGKTDTASVLTEATEYIKFLHDQLQVLSAPYLQTVPTKLEVSERHSLRSRGLCLFHIDAAVGIAQNNGADLWAPAHPSRNQ